MVRNSTRVHVLKALLIASTAIIPVASVSVAHAQMQATLQPASFDVPAQSLSDSLAAFARATGLRIVYPAELAQGKSAPALQGPLTQNQALERLLSGSGLAWRFTRGNAVTIYESSSTAGTGPLYADGSLLLDTITVAGGSGGFSPDTPYETAGSSSYISGKQIERSRGTSVGDFLKGTPGVINADNRAANALDVNIRGMQGQGRAPVIIDGAIQESTVYRGYSGIAGRTYLDPDFIGSVSIEKGPSAKADATGAIGGVVRASTIAVEDILLPGKSYGVRVKGSFNSNSTTPPVFGTPGGSQGKQVYALAALPSSFFEPDGMERPGFLLPTGFSGSIAAAATTENFDFVAAYARRKNGNYFAGTKGEEPTVTIVPSTATSYNVLYEGLTRYRLGEEVLNTSSDNTSFLLKGTLKLGDAHSLEVAYNDYRSDYGEIMPSAILRGDGSFQDNLSKIHSASWTAKYKFNPETDLISLNVNLFHTDVENRINTTFCNAPYGCFPEPYAQKNTRWGVTIDNTSLLDTMIGNFSFNYGGAFTHEDVSPLDGSFVDRDGWRSEWSGFFATKYKPIDWLTLNASVRYSDFKSQDRSGRTGFYTIYKYQEADGSIIELNGDQRKAYLAMGGSGTYLGMQMLMTTNDETYTGSGLAPMFSALVEPVQGLQFYGQYSEAIRLPSIFETTMGTSTNIGPGGFPDQPEHARNWEFGMNWMRDNVLTKGDKIRFKASYFDNTVDDYITRIFAGDSSARMQLANIDYAKLRGFELSAAYDSRIFFGDVAWTHYTYTNYCTKPGQIVSGSVRDLCYTGGVPNGYVVNHVPPKDAVSLTLGTRLFDEKLTLGSKITYVGKRPTSGLQESSSSVGGTLDHFEWKPYTVADLFASYQVNENFRVDMAVDNLTDQYYVDPLALGFVPAPGRTFRLNMTTKF